MIYGRRDNALSATARFKNRTLFVVCTIITGAFAGGIVWAFFKLMNIGLSFLWNELPAKLLEFVQGAFPDITQAMPVLFSGIFGFLPWTLLMCVGGGLAIGFFQKRFGELPEDLDAVMGQVKKTGRYEYNNLGRTSVAALLPLVFGGSVGPEAGLTGVIAGLCTWVGDRMRRFGSDFQDLTRAGVQAALSAVFTAPLYGFVAPLTGSASDIPEKSSIIAPKQWKIAAYLCAVVGALVAFFGLGTLFGSGLGLPHFEGLSMGFPELSWFIVLVVAGCTAGWLFHIGNALSARMYTRLSSPVTRCVIAGLLLAMVGTVLPLTMFAGESQSEIVMELYAQIGAGVLIATGLFKPFITAFCIKLGWRGGHFFPLIFSGICLGYGFALLLGIDPVFSCAACTAACMAAVMRQPLMAALLLFLCFPVKGIVVMFVAALLAAAIPLPRCIKPQMQQASSCDELLSGDDDDDGDSGDGGKAIRSSSGLLGGAIKSSNKEEQA